MNVYIHRRDIRVEDNTTLINFVKYTKNKGIYPIFIFSPEQIDKDKNKYFSDKLVKFMCESLFELKKRYDINFFYGDDIEILEYIHTENPIDNIGFNVDYSPFARNRDKRMIEWSNHNNIRVITQEDMLLVDILKQKTLRDTTKTAYQKFTPFYKRVISYKVNDPVYLKTIKTIKLKNITKFKISEIKIKSFYCESSNIEFEPGRENAIKKIKKLKYQRDYAKCRDIMDYKTSYLSPYINLGIISIREVYKEGIINESFLRELYWRDFYYNILYFYPHIVGNNFNKKKIKWNNNKSYFEKWKKGETGFPIIDACMKQLNETGYMHNRGRMLVSSFLCKDLLIDWKWGEMYFATKLIDYNISANNGGWQWSSGTGVDSQPYFRIFNPWTQSKKYDPDCKYIKKWLPELKEIENKKIHEWYKYCREMDLYIKPIIDHDIQKKKALLMYS